ncbi:MAG: MiaB/RimO family radical SAM methylthiotransferase, partial [Lachnospiraceae bacterium]|nr:MiaB/RimO family radical SAM methylthiotransferase [Lachnospiraceae bacterium]
CVIPSIRGRYRSVPMEQLLNEARKLAADGVSELILVAQEVTLYGVDLYGEKSLPLLLNELNDIEGLQWIRLLYCYPEEIDDALIHAIASLPKVCHYIDMPIQHADDHILKRMGRRTSRADIEEVIGRLRAAIPDICIRTTVICGFPGETEEAHRTLLDFIQQIRFDRLGAFAYSREEGTPAYEMPGQIDEEMKNSRTEEVMLLQQKVIEEKNRALVGSIQTVFIEGKVADEEDVYVGRTYRDAPDVDGYVFIESPYELMSGRLVDVKINEAREYDLIGVLAER